LAKTAFLDTGPLISFIDKREYHNTWINSVFSEIDVSLKTNTAVITEAFFLLKRSSRGEEGLMKMINEGFLLVEDTFSSNSNFIFDVMNKYKNVPCAFADANILAMAENKKESIIITTDSDFLIYRNSKGKPLKLISPYLK
tara:strand:+ start:27240 stop:27662 length:423 start_codon:yes stop_codon:yes gene_type:complete